MTEALVSRHSFPASVVSMEEARVLARLDRIDALDREGAATGELLAELRGLLREAETWTRERCNAPNNTATHDDEEVVQRPRKAPARDIIGM